MKKISISLESIKDSCGAIQAQTGQFNKPLPYYLRQLEDITAEYLLTRMKDTNIDDSASSGKGDSDE